MKQSSSPTVSRRPLLAGIAASLSVPGIAGCTSVGDSSETDDDSADDDSTDDDSTLDDEPPTDVLEGYPTTEVRVTTTDGEVLGAVTAAIPDTAERAETGLSDTDVLPEDRGMLFIFEEVGEQTFAMPDMSFGIDIVFADDEGVITTIHHAPEPEPDEDGIDQQYTGRGQYVLEVGYEWTVDRGVEEGDLLEFEL